MLHIHEYPQPQAFSHLHHRFDSLLSRYGAIRNQITWWSVERYLGKAQECDVRMRGDADYVQSLTKRLNAIKTRASP